jgi:(p)ppGpp synthase/HD superfamily hydrolase
VSGAPYFTHLEAVAHLLDQHGYADDVSLAAAYLHDLIEDQPAFTAELQREMPPEVVDVVSVLTERKLDSAGNERPKAQRFADYAGGLSRDSASAARAIPVSCADRLHNTRSVIEDARSGESSFSHMNTRPGELLDQLGTLRRIYAPVVKGSLLAALDAATDELGKMIRRWLPGRAAVIASQAHLGQFDKAGEPYILHPMRLAVRASTPEERIVALLHDVVEDSDVTLEELAREGFGPAVVRALECLTRKPGETYDTFIERIAADKLATRVKLLDLEDNADLSRLRNVSPEDRERARKYHRAKARLEAELEERLL